MERVQFLVGHRALDGRHAARLAVGAPKGIDQGAVIGAMAGGLDDDIALETEEVAQGEELLPRRVARRIFTLRREGEDIARPEDVAMGIDRAFRQLEFRLRGVGAPVEPVGVFFKSHL